MSVGNDRTHWPSRVSTGVQHASTFVLVLGAFVSLAALNTEPAPEGFVKWGFLLILCGIIGFIAGWLGRLFFTRSPSR